MPKHEIIVGNIGIIYSGDDEKTASLTYDEYVGISQRNVGRAGGEPVAWMRDGELYQDYTYPPPNPTTTVYWVSENEDTHTMGAETANDFESALAMAISREAEDYEEGEAAVAQWEEYKKIHQVRKSETSGIFRDDLSVLAYSTISPEAASHAFFVYMAAPEEPKTPPAT